MKSEIKKYPDGTSYAVIDPNEPEFTFRINSYEELWHLRQLVEAYNKEEITPHILIPNLLDAQADRRFNLHESSGLKLVMNFLSSMDAKFLIFHPHNSEVVEAGIPNANIIDNQMYIRMVMSDLTSKYYSKMVGGNSPEDRLILMSSDAGGFKPLMKLADQLKWEGETFSAAKARTWSKEDGTKFTQKVDRDDFEGKDILIIDDISVYGGTFKGLSKLLRERNCGKLFLAVSHMTMQNMGKDPVTNYFDQVYTTNSKFDFYAPPKDGNAGYQPKNLKVIKYFN